MAMMNLINRNKTPGLAIASAAMKSLTTEATNASSAKKKRYVTSFNSPSVDSSTTAGKIRHEICDAILRNHNKNPGSFGLDPISFDICNLTLRTNDLAELRHLHNSVKLALSAPPTFGGGRSHPFYSPCSNNVPPPADLLLNKDKEKDNPSTVDVARLAVKLYQQHMNMELEFMRVRQVWEEKYGPGLDRHMLVEAYDCAASRVPITLSVEYSLPHYTIKVVRPYIAGHPFMEVLGNKEMMDKGTNIVSNKVMALLFANTRGCPVINKRMGLTGWDEVVDQLGLDQVKTSSLRSCYRGKFLKVALDEPKLLRMAEFALSKQDQSSQESCLHLTKNMDAWREVLVGDFFDMSMYHIVLEAEAKGGVARMFYAAVVASQQGKPLALANWIPVDSPRAAMNLP